jgi:small subunit ribosomal protein S3
VGQKVNPHGLRLGVIKNWEARWFADRDFADLLLEDVKIRDYIKEKTYQAGVSSIQIERVAKRVQITVYTAKPGMVIGRGGSGVEALRKELEKRTGKQIHINIQEIRTPELDAQLVAEGIAGQIERRTSYRRAMKQAMQRSMRAGAKGVKVIVSGRLGGAEIARTEGYREGSVPLQTLRADIDYGFAEACTTYGRIGVKVWIYKGEVLPEAPEGKVTGTKKEAAGEGGK